MKTLKMTIKLNVNFGSMVLNILFPSQYLFFERAVDLRISLYNTNVGWPFFVKFSSQNQFAGGFP